MIYLDNAATTKPTPEIIKLHQRISEEYWYNTNSIHTLGIKANTLLEQSINVVKDSLKVKNKKVIYTSSATSSQFSRPPQVRCSSPSPLVWAA